MSLNIIFQDEDFVVLNKEPEVLSVPSRIGSKEQRRILGIELQDYLKQQIFPIHRLDYEVSGLILYAKNLKASSLAQGWFENKIIYKTYQALTVFSEGQGISNQLPEVWTSKLVRGKKRTFKADYGKESVTQILSCDKEKNENILRWQLQPITGRSHQLRFELSHRGFYILGDSLYGYKNDLHFNWRQKGIALECIKLEFPNNNLKTPFKSLELSIRRF
jgi:tRNA pseudouridine32 synthase/23S rRNA pseudouridine746 synthase